jgi:hypothetical protein
MFRRLRIGVDKQLGRERLLFNADRDRGCQGHENVTISKAPMEESIRS